MDRRLFEPLVMPPGSGGGKRRAGLLPVSLVIHAVVLGIVVLAPILASEELPSLATDGTIMIPATLVPRPPPPRGVSPDRVMRRSSRAAAPAPAVRASVIPFPTSVPELPPAEDPGWGLTEIPVCEGCVPWGVAEGVPIEGPVARGVMPEEPVFRVGTGVEPPVKLRDVQPEYPELAILTGLAGVVIVECRVDKRGRVVNARVLRGHPLLDAAALGAIRQWRYRPTLLNGEPVSVIMTVTVRFQLQR